MKRIFPIVVVGVMISTLGIGTLAVALFLAWPGDKEKRAITAPFSYKQLKDMEEKPDKVAGEIPRLIACFASDDLDICAQASETLKIVGEKAVDPLRENLSDKNANVRFWSAQTLAHIGPEAARASSELVKSLADTDAKVRYKSAYALGQIGVKSDAVFTGLIQALEDKDADVPSEAISALAKLGAPPAEAIPALTKLATKDDAAVRHAAIGLLGKLGAPAVPTFKLLLKNTKIPEERLVVVGAVVALGTEAKPLVPELVSLLDDQIRQGGGFIDPQLIEVFKKCGPDGGKALAQELKEIDRESIAFIARQSILKGIGDMRSPEEAKATVPILIELLKKNTPTHAVVEYRHLILEALGDIGVAANASIPQVESLTNDPAPLVASGARVALKRMGKITK
jgi:HEAT repeat protein